MVGPSPIVLEYTGGVWDIAALGVLPESVQDLEDKIPLLLAAALKTSHGDWPKDALEQVSMLQQFGDDVYEFGDGVILTRLGMFHSIKDPSAVKDTAKLVGSGQLRQAVGVVDCRFLW